MDCISEKKTKSFLILISKDYRLTVSMKKKKNPSQVITRFLGHHQLAEQIIQKGTNLDLQRVLEILLQPGVFLEYIVFLL